MTKQRNESAFEATGAARVAAWANPATPESPKARTAVFTVTEETPNATPADR